MFSLLFFTFSDLLVSLPFVMHLSAFALLQVHGGEGRVCSLSHQKGLASQKANMSQRQPYGRKLWVVCWQMQGWDGDLALRAATIRASHLQLLHLFHMCKVVTDAFMVLFTIRSFCLVSNSCRLFSERMKKSNVLVYRFAFGRVKSLQMAQILKCALLKWTVTMIHFESGM